jgi:predicted metal-dependent TIM-barrel fold hydrolase
MLEIYGPERLWINSACDWGVSDPLAVPRCMLEMQRRQHTAAAIEQIVYHNPRKFLRQSPRFV